ncbi:MAG: GAF domain-containing protein, partial [Campylobacterota bacterium]|nr:GAF domain-containing protein [Campylobacterota bacterium]
RVKEMELVNGYYGTMEDFAWISKSIKIMKGQGLPGKVWKSTEPTIMQDLAESATFMRAKKALKEGITTALALPAWSDETQGYVMTFLSAKGTPIARRFEIWQLNHEEENLSFKEGYSHGEVDLDELYSDITFDKNDSLVGECWRQGLPRLVKNSDNDYAPKDCESILTIPIIQNGFCQSVVSFYY